VIVEKLRAKLPKTKILVTGVLPRRGDNYCPRYKAINEIVANLETNSMVRVLNMEKAFISSDCNVKSELYVSDGLHLTAAGYNVWATTMNPLLNSMLNEY
jgi:lysophospholipase L1-like esterase